LTFIQEIIINFSLSVPVCVCRARARVYVCVCVEGVVEGGVKAGKRHFTVPADSLQS